MVDFFKDVFNYHRHTNGQLIQLFNENPEKTTDEMLGLLSHNIIAHQIWNARILSNTPGNLSETYTLEECEELNDSTYSTTIGIINDSALSEVIKYENTKGVKFSNSIQEILFHLSNHHTHHRGQIIALLRPNGMTPMITDYIWYKR